MLRRLLSPRLLHLANANARSMVLERDRFYALKKYLLERFGRFADFDLQYIPPGECWQCNGAGQEIWSDGEKHTCYKCGGSGLFGCGKWFSLWKYRWGRFTFHIPKDRFYSAPQSPVTIKGRIEHHNVDERTSKAAAIWLALFWDQWLCWRLLTTSAYVTPGWRPILWINKFAMWASMTAQQFKPRRCCRCRRRFIRPSRRVMHFQCRRCDRDSRQLVDAFRDEIPF